MALFFYALNSSRYFFNVSAKSSALLFLLIKADPTTQPLAPASTTLRAFFGAQSPSTQISISQLFLALISESSEILSTHSGSIRCPAKPGLTVIINTKSRLSISSFA